ncbi:hypothetical protein JCM8547_000700 [Rhodosporidiobolus lusitaniae]
MGIDAAQPADSWFPPTPPRSNLVPLPTPTLPVDHLVLLPPPALSLPSPNDDDDKDYTMNEALFPQASKTGSLPSLAPLLSSSSTSSSASSAFFPPPDSSTTLSRSAQEASDALLAARLAHENASPSTSSSSRPRRSAAIVAARNIPRQPSPFDLEDDGEGGSYVAGKEEDEDGEEDYEEENGGGASPGPSSSASRKRSASSSAAPAGGASKRKVSHSLIERRRREKINQCLMSLKETVPSLKEEGKRKMAKARERGRKRGRGEDAGERGGLHKLEILQGTIQYIDELRLRINALENQQHPSPSSSKPTRPTRLPSPDSLTASATTSSASLSPPLLLPSPILRASISSAIDLASRGPLPSLSTATSFTLTAQPGESSSSSSSGGSATVDDVEAVSLLHYFSTSPELRPVQM